MVTEGDSVIGIIDEFLDMVTNASPPVNPHLIGFSQDLALKTNHRNSVKVGIALIGVCRDKNCINEVKIIGLHDEFTLFSMVAIGNLSENLVDDFWEMAKKVDGWGKIHIVERLAKMDLPSHIKKWLITDGYKNSIMYEYLAYTCAVAGDLDKVMEEETIDYAMFKSSGEIIEALIAGGPAEDISHYKPASTLISSYIRHGLAHATDVSDFNILNQLKDFLIELQADIGEHAENGWTQDIISNCLIDIVKIVSRADWPRVATKALDSSDNVVFWNAKKAAKALQIDFWDIVWSRLKKSPFESLLWYDVVHEAKPGNVDEVLKFAMEVLPLNELATGPRDSLGMGPEFDKHKSLDYIITFLEDFPRKGEPILLGALDSPVTRNRNMAIKVLHKWGKANWSESLLMKLEQLSKIEPNKDTKQNISRVLKGEELNY
jgi:hypothetical protein